MSNLNDSQVWLDAVVAAERLTRSRGEGIATVAIESEPGLLCRPDEFPILPCYSVAITRHNRGRLGLCNGQPFDEVENPKARELIERFAALYMEDSSTPVRNLPLMAAADAVKP